MQAKKHFASIEKLKTMMNFTMSESYFNSIQLLITIVIDLCDFCHWKQLQYLSSHFTL